MSNTVPPPFPVPEVCTLVHGRNPKWKIHTKVGQAITAIMYNYRGGDLWRVVDGEWVLEYSVTRNDFRAADGRVAPYIVAWPGVCRMSQGKDTLDIITKHSDEIELLSYDQFNSRFHYSDLIKPKDMVRLL